MALKSSHFKATAPAISGNILGDFDKANHTFIYDKNTKIVMEKRNDSLYQVLYKNGKELRHIVLRLFLELNMHKLRYTGEIAIPMNYLFLTIIL
jgi:hypothetical protein